jgi:GntR family transcriptional regulator
MSASTEGILTPHELSRLLERCLRPGIPKYTALRDAVVHAVANGRCVPGDRVPNEQELASVLPISLGTIQRGLRQLVEEGVVQRRQGQGSFIAGRTDDGEMSQPFHCRFVDDSGSGYLPVFPEATGRRVLKAPGEWSKALSAKEGLEITRRIRIGTEFAVFSSFVVDPKRLQVFASLPLRKLKGENFKDVIFRASGQAIQRVDLFLRQTRAPADVAETIGIAGKEMCMSLRAVAYLGDSDPIYYQQIFIPPSQRELHIISDSRANGFR